MFIWIKEAEYVRRDSYEMTPEEALEQDLHITKSRLFLGKIRSLHLEKLTGNVSILVSYNGICFDDLLESKNHDSCADMFVYEPNFILEVIKHISRYGEEDVLKKAKALW